MGPLRATFLLRGNSQCTAELEQGCFNANHSTMEPMADSRQPSRPSPTASATTGDAARHRTGVRAGESEDSAWQLPADWQRVLAGELSAPGFRELVAFVERERSEHSVYPPAGQVFQAFRETPLERVRVVILGQDPYHGEGQAHGLCFSVAPGVTPPPSLMNIFRELADDLGVPLPGHGCLTHWARQGVLLLNTVLTVRAGKAHSHRRKGWETVTDAVIDRVSNGLQPVVFVLWGRPAEAKLPLIDVTRHEVLVSAHPSPLSARRGFFGSRPFSRINRLLESWGQAPIDWQLPELPQ